ncbi:hypothetical protein ABVT39_019081 [Epinephelus coioides]
MINSLPEPENGLSLQFKYPDGGLKRRRFPVPSFSPAPSPTHSPLYISSNPSSPDREDIAEPFDIVATLQTLKSRVNHLAPKANQINVLRNEAFDCALRAFRRPAFDPESRLDIVFIDEDGQGEGSIDDSVALHNNTYRIVGQMLANFFSKRLFSQVCGLPSGPATIDKVVDHGLKAKLEKASLENITQF